MRGPLLLAGLVIAAGATALSMSGEAEPPAAPAAPALPAQMAPSRMLQGGYLAREALPDSLVLLPPPPGRGSAAMKRDEEAAKAAVRLRGSPRWEQAAIDADLFTPNSIAVFSCAAGRALGPQTTPRLDALLRKAGPNLAMAVYPAKRQYQRPRPFMVNHQPSCTPKDEAVLRNDGSYPSGHSAIGYGWGLILAEVLPDRSAQLVLRGEEFGDSRRVCNVHWQSDVEAGRAVAAAVVARMHAEPAFREDVAAARAEIEASRPTAGTPDCDRETAAFAIP